MTRAWISFFKLDISAALKYHPLFWMIPIMGVIQMQSRKISKKLYCVLMLGMIICILSVYCVRLFAVENTMITVNISDGFLWKMFNYIRESSL